MPPAGGRRSGDSPFPGALEAGAIDQKDLETDSSLVRSLLYIPLTSRDEWIGILALDRRGEGDERHSGPVSGAFKAILSQGLLAIRDVAELRALKEYNDKVLVSVSTSGEMLLVIDSRGTILAANSATTDVLGFEEAELIGRSLLQVVERESSGMVAESFLGRSASTRRPQLRDAVPGPSWTAGCRGWCPPRTSSTARTRRRRSSCSPGNISRELREAERGRDESERRYRLLFERVLDAVVTFDEDGRFIDMNPAGRALRGRRRGGRGQWGGWGRPRGWGRGG